MTTTTTTPNLELVPTYRLVDKPCARRTFELGMRWWPPCRDQPPDTKGEAIPHRGFSALRSLKDGDSLNEERLDAAVAYLDAALDYFRHRPPDGFMPADECRSAIVELTELRDYLR